MVCACWRREALGKRLLSAVRYQGLPSAGCRLERIEVESNQVIEEETFYLTTKYEDFGTEKIQRVSISTGGAVATGYSLGPVLGSCSA